MMRKPLQVDMLAQRYGVRALLWAAAQRTWRKVFRRTVEETGGLPDPVIPNSWLRVQMLARQNSVRTLLGAAGQRIGRAIIASAPKVDASELPTSNSPLQASILARRYSTGTLVRAAAHRLRQKAGGGQASPIVPAISYADVVVFDRRDLDGWGMNHEQDLWRVLIEHGPHRCDDLFEFCAGPAYIGFSLLARRYCKRLTVADINPAAMEAVQETVRRNHLEGLVRSYVSDVLDGIPDSERWDVAIGNPPPFFTEDEAANIIEYDRQWSLHRRFYASIGKFMKPGGRVVLIENPVYSNAELFETMIRDGGGRLIAAPHRTTLDGRKREVYYVVSEW